MVSLRTKITSGIFWNIVERMSLHGIKLIVSIILARILEPSMFGIYGMLSLLLAVSQAILDSGFGPALIQKKEASHLDYCSIFYINLFIGVVLTGLLFVTAPWIADFFKIPELLNLTRFLSLNLILNGFGLVQSSIYSREMKFKKLFQINSLAAFLSGIVGIILAYRGFGIWSIAWQSVLSTLFTSAFLWLFNSWRPTLIFSMESVKSMFSFGSRLLISDLVSTAFNNIYQTLIGKFYSAAELGYYSNSRSMINALLNITSGSLGKVLLPSFSPLQDNIDHLKRVYRKAIRYTAFLHFPLMIGLWATAEQLIPLLLTEKWLGSIPIIRLLCISDLLYPLHLLNLNVLKVKGRSDLYLNVSLFKKVFVIAAILLTYKEGIAALLYGQIVNTVIAFFINGFFTSKLISYSTFQQIKDTVPTMIISFIMGAAMVAVEYLGLGNPLFIILTKVIVGIVVYLAINIMIDYPMVKELWNLAMNFLFYSRSTSKGDK